MPGTSTNRFPLTLDTEKYKRAVITVYILTIFVQILDTTIINVAIPALADHFGTTDTEIDRAIIGYLVSLAIFIPTSGWLANRFGSRLVFSTALAIFTIASGLCGFSESLGQLVIFRVLQGMGAGVMGPLGAAILYRAFPQNERAKAATAVISVAVIAPAIGPILGGAIIESLSWRWIFYVNLPIGIVALIVGALVIEDFRGTVRVPFDLIGFVLAGAGLGGLLFGVTIAREEGWTDPLVLGTVIVGALFLIALPAVEKRQPNPLLKLDLFDAPIFRSVNILAFPLYAGFMAVIFIMPVYLQSLRGFSAFETGLAVFPQAVGVWVSSQIVGRLVYKRTGPRRLLIAGLTATLIVGLVIARFDLDTSINTIRLVLFARGLCMGMVFIAVQTSVYSQTSVEDTAQATAIFSANRQTAPAFGVAMAATVIGLIDSSPDPSLDAYQGALLAAALIFVPAIIAVWWVRDSDAAATFGT